MRDNILSAGLFRVEMLAILSLFGAGLCVISIF